MWAKFMNWIFGIDEMIREFEKHFPGKCLICAYNRYGISQGYATGETKKHACLEKRKDQP